jgi:tetratricopeptide (TPR) repeat protein
MKTILLGVLLAGAVSPNSFAQEAAAPATLDVWLPSKAWALELEAPGFIAKANEIQPDGRRYFRAEDAKSRMIVSVFLESMKGAAKPEECKRSLEEKVKHDASLSLNGLKGVSYREVAGMEAVEFSMAEFNGVPVNQKNILGCLIKEDVFVDIHVSKVFFKAADQPALETLLRSFHFVAREPATAAVPVGNSLKLFQLGSRYYLAQQYREAIGPYQQALQIEKVAPTLEKKLWYVLVDNLAMAYGMTNDLENSQKVIAYGISRDPNYPLFYYNLACIAGEKGDARNAKANLKLAYDRRSNALEGEAGIPDARTDDSFQKLMQDKNFRLFVDSLYAGRL